MSTKSKTKKNTKRKAGAHSLDRLVRTLRELEKTWPSDVWLFAASGGLHLMQKQNGKRAMIPLDGGAKGGGADPQQIIATFGGIECDGGDW